MKPWIDTLRNAVSMADRSLERALLVPGPFSAIASGVDPATVKAALVETDLFQERGGVSLLYTEDDTGLPPTIQALESWPAPVPPQLRASLFGILDGLFSGWTGGWSVDLFWSEGGGASIGPHVDNDDVFSVQLLGRKMWKVKPRDFDDLTQLVALGIAVRTPPSETWYLDSDSKFDGETFVLRPGDLIAVPAFAVHCVTAIDEGPALSVNVSIRQERLWRDYLKTSSSAIAQQRALG